MRKTALMLVAFSCLTISAFAGNQREADVRKVTIYPLTHYFSYEALPHTSVVDSIEASHSEFLSMTVTVSDDPGKSYAIDCFAYRVWHNCGLPAASSDSAEIETN